MNLEIDQQDLNYLIDGVVEELNQIEEPVAVAKAILENDCSIRKEGKTKGIKLFEDYIARYKLLIKLWKLDEDKEQAKKSIVICRNAIAEAFQVIKKIKHLTEVPSDRKARQN